MYSDPQHLVVFEVVEVRRASSVNVERLCGCSVSKSCTKFKILYKIDSIVIL